MVATALYPDLPLNEALFQTARRDLQTYIAETLVGRASRTIFLSLGVRRALLTLPRLLRQAISIPRFQVVEIAPQQVEVIAPRILLPMDYALGFFIEYMSMAGAINPTAEVREKTPERAVIRLTWQATAECYVP